MTETKDTKTLVDVPQIDQVAMRDQLSELVRGSAEETRTCRRAAAIPFPK